MGKVETDATCYVERSKVREILIASDIDNENTRTVLQAVDALPIVTAGDFRTLMPAPATLNDDQIMDILRKVTRDELFRMLTFTRWKDGIDIDYPTFAAQRLAAEFRAPAESPLMADRVKLMGGSAVISDCETLLASSGKTSGE